MAYKTSKNLLTEKDVYNRYYGDFRGVDFSSDHTQVHERRLAYMVNMFKDYQSGQGQAIETIAGFRRRVVLPEASEIYGIFNFAHKDAEGNTVTDVLIHAGNKLYLWANYPEHGKRRSYRHNRGACSDFDNKRHPYVQTDAFGNIVEVVSLATISGDDLTPTMSYDPETRELTYASSVLAEGERLTMTYKEGVIKTQDALYSDMNNRRSASFIFNNRLYIIDGKNYLFYDGETVNKVVDSAYIRRRISTSFRAVQMPTTARSTSRGICCNRSSGIRLLPDGTTTDFYLNENLLDEVSEVKCTAS